MHAEKGTYKYIDGKLSTEECTPETHKFIGMWRPTFDQVLNYQAKHNFNGHQTYCPGIHADWTNGYYDKPIYERINKQ